MSGEAVLVPLIWESIAGVADAVEATVAARKQAAQRKAEAQLERIQAWQDFQSRQQQTQVQLRLSREAVHQAQQQLINSGLQQAATRVHSGAVAEGFVEQGGMLSGERAAGLMADIERQLVSLPAELFNDERLPFTRLRSQLQRMQQATKAGTIDEVNALGSMLQRSFADYIQRADQEVEQQRKQVAGAEQLLTRIIETRELSLDDEDAAYWPAAGSGAWLVATGRLANPDALDQVLWDTQSSEQSKLESVLQLMDPELPRPQLSVKFLRINFGRLAPEQPRSKTIVIRNAGRGHLSGDLRLQDYDRGFTIDNSVVEGNETVIRLSASSLGMPENSRQQTTLIISSNGGDHTIHLAYQVPRQQRQRPLPDLQEILLTFFRHVNPRYLVTVGILVFFIINLTLCHDASDIPF